jgi:hypothetical protein
MRLSLSTLHFPTPALPLAKGLRCTHKFWKVPKDITLAPLTPQFWGEMTRDLGFLPPYPLHTST